ncbi:MAG: glycerol-3-phosphate acyltransferase PlsX [Limisphaerales bacterium]|jgi:glycerol-3-phosphate acyltransferase PlsX
MRIAADVMGGDSGCAVIIDGLLQALEHHDPIRTMYLVGDEDTIRPALGQAGHLAARIEVVHSPEVLSMDDKPVVGLRRKKNCSLAMATDLVKHGQADAVLSAGNTGGMVAAATIKLRTLPGVDRPGIATVMPTKTGNFVLLDAGANVEGKPRHLMHYAIMGDIYAREVLGKSRPRVGLLSVGTEEAKGNELTLETFKLCSGLDLNFIGNVEGHDLFGDDLDVVVCNGFVGNVVLKTCESLALHMMSWLKDELTATPIRRLGAALSKNAFRSLKNRIDTDSYGGAPLLGVNGIVTISHGSANARAIRNAVQHTVEAVDHHINDHIIDAVAKANAVFSTAEPEPTAAQA